jgi:hypothetical protein
VVPATISINDLLVLRLHKSFHFGVVGRTHLIHADAALGRVVSRKLPSRLGPNAKIFRIRRD